MRMRRSASIKTRTVARSQTRWLCVERLEARALLANITVNTAADDNDPTSSTLSLREAIEISNRTLAVSALSPQAQAQVSGALSKPNTIAFNIPTGTTAVATIAPTSALPEITAPIIIDGYTQPGAHPNTLADGDNAVLRIELDGTNAGFVEAGLVISAGGSMVRGLVINRFNPGNPIHYLRLVYGGIELKTLGDNVIEGNFLGTDAGGSVAMGNSLGGLAIVGSSNNTIGGTTPAARNLISGNQEEGVRIIANFGPTNVDAAGNLVVGNFVGTDFTGTKALGNGTPGSGFIIDATHNTIGGATAGARNIISGNGEFGVEASNINEGFNLVQGNFIGTDVTGTKALPNVLGGVNFSGMANTVGGTVAGAGNLISGNGGYGVGIGYIYQPQNPTDIVQGNFIGTDATGTKALGNSGNGVEILYLPNNTIGGTVAGAGNTIAFNGIDGVAVSAYIGIGSGTVIGDAALGNLIRSNSIFSNTNLGIELINGANKNQQAPTLTAAIINPDGSTTVQGTLKGTPGTTYTLEFFGNTTCPPSGPGQGQTVLGTTTATADSNGNVSFAATVQLPTGEPFVTATATDPGNNTSEFSACVQEVRPPTVVRLQRFGFHYQPTIYVLTFSTGLDPARAHDVANYRLAPVFGRRLGRDIPITAAIYDPVADTVTLKPTTRVYLFGRYRLAVNGSTPTGVAGATGLLLDGQGTGRPGTDFVTTFGEKILAGPNLPVRAIPRSPHHRSLPKALHVVRSLQSP